MLLAGLLLSTCLSSGSPPPPVTLGPIDEDMVDKYADALVHTPSGSVLSVRVDSPGGDVLQLLRLLGLSDEASHRQITIVCRVSGVAASAAAVFFVAGCDRRLMGPKAVLVFHEAYIRAMNPLFSSVPDPKMQHSLDGLNHIMAMLVSTYSHLTVEEYEKTVKLGDWYLQASEAVELGLADVGQ